MAGTMNLTPRERMIYVLAQDEQWEGTVESPSDAFVALWLDAKERNLIAAAEDIDFGDVPKYWVVTEDNRGFLQFNDFTNAADQQAFFDSRMQEYVAWCEDDDDGFSGPWASDWTGEEIEYPLADLGNLLTRIKEDEDGPLALP